LQIAFFVIFLKILQLIKCEPPSSFYSRPSGRPFMPTIPPSLSDSYGPPPPPAIPSNSYGLPAEYGPPIESETPAPIIHKHVYIHIPPPEPEYVEIPNDPVQQPVQKHYRIIFIKAPTMAAPTAQVPAVQAVTEEKTIVYVLVKKPDNVREVLPTPPTTLPSKPEVYFIRYKTEEKTTLTPEIENGGYYKKR
jgi:hypothetical protein